MRVRRQVGHNFEMFATRSPHVFLNFSRTRPKRSQLQPPGEAAQRPSKGISDLHDDTRLLCSCSGRSCRSCVAAPRGGGALALIALAALAALASLAVLEALSPLALPVP